MAMCGCTTAIKRRCRATTDYWVNAMDGQPFFLLNQAVDPGMLQVLEHEIVPRLEQEVPSQPTREQLAADAKLHRFTLIFDREGYSPEFLRTLKKKRRLYMDSRLVGSLTTIFPAGR